MLQFQRLQHFLF